MRDPIVEEVRRLRMEHTKRFRGDLALIFQDLRKLEAQVGDRLVRARPRYLKPAGGPSAAPNPQSSIPNP